jgi:hypothetical protein
MTAATNAIVSLVVFGLVLLFLQALVCSESSKVRKRDTEDNDLLSAFQKARRRK